MTKIKSLLFSLVCMAAATGTATAQGEQTGLPGDNFSLQGALDMFKKASSIEEFEKLINTSDKHVNNLDLNEDGETDYIKVIDKADKDVHAFVLQVAVSESENQDVAVIELEKTGDTTAVLQIVGDEDIFGEQVIVEASDEGDEPEAAGTQGSGPAFDEMEATRFVVNVFYWPSVRFVYRPAYRPWASPWSWRHYPGWWKPWRPLSWSVFHPRVLPYHRHYAVVRTHRVVVAHRVYIPHRVVSVTVRKKTTIARSNYRVTRTRVTGPRGNTRVKTTVRKRGKRG